jgi:hypothetical protein
MSNDLIELTDTELDAVSGGITPFKLEFGNIVTQVNVNPQIAEVANIGVVGGNTNINQTSNNMNYVGSQSFSLWI